MMSCSKATGRGHPGPCMHAVRRTLLALATFAIMIVVHPAVHQLWTHHVPGSLGVIPGTLQTLGPIPPFVMLFVIGPGLWRAGGRTRAVGIGALVGAVLVSAWGFVIALGKFGLRPH